MDKKHASCSNLHPNSSVKYLIEKFEGICKLIHEGPSEQIREPKCKQLSSKSGHVALTVAKFEECLFIPGDNKTCQVQASSSGEPCTGGWMLELNEKIAQHVKRQEKLALMDQQQHKKLALMDRQQRKQQQQQEQLQQEQQQLDANPLEGHLTETFPLPIDVSKTLGIFKAHTLLPLGNSSIRIIEKHLAAIAKKHSYETIKTSNCLPISLTYLSISLYLTLSLSLSLSTRCRWQSSNTFKQQLRLVDADESNYALLLPSLRIHVCGLFQY